MRKRKYEVDVTINDLPKVVEIVAKLEPMPEPKKKVKREFVKHKRITINSHVFTLGEPILFGFEKTKEDIHFWKLSNPETTEEAYLGFHNFRVFERVSKIYHFDDHCVVYYYGERNGRLYIVKATETTEEEFDCGLAFRWGRLPEIHHIEWVEVAETIPKSKE